MFYFYAVSRVLLLMFLLQYEECVGIRVFPIRTLHSVRNYKDVRIIKPTISRSLNPKPNVYRVLYTLSLSSISFISYNWLNFTRSLKVIKTKSHMDFLQLMKPRLFQTHYLNVVIKTSLLYWTQILLDSKAKFKIL